ncbi:MAG: PE-PPE domain-containing protein [Mycobacterium sp.]
MAKHRAVSARAERSRAAVKGVKRAMVPALGSAAAVATVAAIGTPQQPDVDLAALVVEGSSTNPTGTGIPAFYAGLFNPLGTTVVDVNFFTGPFGVYDALQGPQDDERDVVLSSGWGAANVSLLLTFMDLTNATDPALTEPLYVLDNNVARPNGGFGTRYPIFGVIGVNPIPSPTSPGAQVIDVGYEYDINGNTPAYVLNVVSMANSLATYFDNRLNQNDVVLPVDPETGECTVCEEDWDGAQFETVVDGRTVVIKRVGETTYISYRTEGLPLLEPLRQFGGEAGIRIAYVIEPALTAVVNYGYPNNDALANPEQYVPARLVPSAAETETFLNEFADGVQVGLDRLDDEEIEDESADADEPELLTTTVVSEGTDEGNDEADDEDEAEDEADDDDEAEDSPRRPGGRFTPLSGVREAAQSWRERLRGGDQHDVSLDEGATEDDDATSGSDDGPNVSTP